MKEKKSFFQKLTGGYQEDDDLRTLSVSSDDADLDSWHEDASPQEGELGVDMYQTEKDVIIEAMVAGVRPEDLQVNITRDIVTISGKREANKSVMGDNYFFQELYWGSFSRSVMLPHEIDIEGAEAVEKHGMLIIKLPKIDKKRQNKLKVKAL